MTWLQTASGRAFDLLRPDWRQVDFEVDIPEALARIARFTGHVRSGPYSVAQHCVVGADAIFAASKDKQAAAAFLLHDAHEAYLGDIATPIVWAMMETAAQGTSEAGDPKRSAAIIRNTIRLMKRRLDEAVYRAAGADLLHVVFATTIAEYDLRMLVTERAHLLGKSPQPWLPAIEAAQPIRLVGKLTCWPWHRAADEYRDRLRRYLPDQFNPAPLPISGLPNSAARRKLAEALS